MSNTQSYCPHTRQALVTLDSTEESWQGSVLPVVEGSSSQPRLIQFSSQGFQVYNHLVLQNSK